MRVKRFIYIVILTLSLLSFTNYSKFEAVEKDILFKIDRSRDADAIFYNLNINDSRILHRDNPIDVMWVRNSEHGQIEPLTWIQNRYAYGVKLLGSNNGDTKFCFVSYPEREFTLRPKNNRYKVYTISNNREVEVNRIYIQFNGGTFWIPIITKIELHGVSNGIATVEIIIP